jgi:hypothetical protein
MSRVMLKIGRRAPCEWQTRAIVEASAVPSMYSSGIVELFGNKPYVGKFLLHPGLTVRYSLPTI